MAHTTRVTGNSCCTLVAVWNVVKKRGRAMPVGLSTNKNSRLKKRQASGKDIPMQKDSIRILKIC